MKNSCMFFNFIDFYNVNKIENGLGVCCNDKRRKKRIFFIYVYLLSVVDN